MNILIIVNEVVLSLELFLIVMGMTVVSTCMWQEISILLSFIINFVSETLCVVLL